MPPSPTRPLSILATGVAVPSKLLTAHELDLQLGLREGDSAKITGIHQRHIAGEENASQLAARAVTSALAAAGISLEEIDCLVCASATMDQALPYNAAMLHVELGPTKHRLATLDIGASCLSFFQALDLMSFALLAGKYQTIVIVSSDIASFTTDYRNLRENGIFGDGAAAVVIRRSQPSEASSILASRSITLPEGAALCQIQSGGSRFHRRGNPHHAEAFFEMRGRELYSLVGRNLPTFVEMLLAEAGVSQQEIKLFIPHQASRQALDHVARMLGFADGRMVDVFGRFGNQVGASMPTALHFAITEYDLKRGDKALLLGSGAGVSIGGMVFTY